MAEFPSTDPERLRRVNALLEIGLALQPGEREEWLLGLPPEQQPLVPTLRAMLARDSAETDGFLRRPVGVTLKDLGTLEHAADRPGDEVGPYRLIRELGSGGMATVWLAERFDGAPRRQVALKLPRTGWAPGLVQRMARERDILASLEHPHIARLYDAGTTASGRPYLAMEYVEGVPIDEYARRNSLGIPARLRLILQVASAVAHAHARLVVHRDLKPSNILVTAAGDVRLLDFGVAGLLQDEGTRETRLTQFAGRALTPDYASPEQIRGEPTIVGSDVYSLAVVLYELLAGERPYKLKNSSAAALEAAILEAEVPPASQRAPDRALARVLRGDLDNILAKALKKSPVQRYATMEALADDLVRYLGRLPVRAVGDSMGYRLKRFAQRNVVALSASGAIAIAVVAGAGAALWQAHEASVQRDRALQRLARNTAVSDFLEVMFTQGVPPGQGPVIQEMLRRSEAYASAARLPEHQAAVLLLLATQLAYLAEPARAAPLLERASDLLRGSADRDLQAQVACTRSMVAAFLGRNDEALALIEPWLAADDIDDHTAATCLLRRSERARDGFDAASTLRYSQMALDRLARAKAPPHSLEATLHAERGNAMQLSGRGLEADREFERALGIFAALGRPDAADAIITRANWAASMLSAGDVQRSLSLCLEALRAQEAQSGPNSNAALTGNCAYANELLARYDEALKLYGQVLLAVESGGNVVSRVYALAGQATVWLQKGEMQRAREALDRARAAVETADFPAGHVIRIRYQQARARLDLATGDARAAAASLDRVIEVLVERGTRNGALAAAYRLRAAARGAMQDTEAALADANASIEVSRSLQAGRPHSLHTGLAYLGLADLLAMRGEQKLSEQAARQALEHLRTTAGADHPETLRASRLLKTR